MEQWDKVVDEVRKPGSLARRICFTLSFFVLGLLFVLLGFWKTLLIAAITLLGVFIGSSADPVDAVRKLINRLFPPASKTVTYTAEDKEKVKKALEKREKPKAEETEEPQDKA